MFMAEKALNRTNWNICLLKQRGTEVSKSVVTKIFNSSPIAERSHDFLSLFEGTFDMDWQANIGNFMVRKYD